MMADFSLWACPLGHRKQTSPLGAETPLFCRHSITGDPARGLVRECGWQMVRIAAVTFVQQFERAS